LLGVVKPGKVIHAQGNDPHDHHRLFTATRAIPIWTSVLVILLLVSAEVTYLGLHHHSSVINDLADLGVLNSIGQISYLAGVFLLA
jgi:hypothetical protein